MAESVHVRAARRRTSLSFPGKALTVLALLHLYIGLRLLSPWPPAGIVLGAAALVEAASGS